MSLKAYFAPGAASGGLFDNTYIQQFWCPTSYTTATPPNFITNGRLNSTHDWTYDHLFHFHLHIFRCNNDEWKTYLCPPLPLTPDAQQLSDYQVSNYHFIEGTHQLPPFDQDYIVCRDYGDIISEILSRAAGEAVVDRLAFLLLNVCNCNKAALQVVGQLNAVPIQVGEHNFISIPDRLVVMRLRSTDPTRYMFLVAEDKKGEAEDIEGQLGGEMLGAALLNFDKYNTDQTVFGMALRGVMASVYRADFPASYLQSIRDNGTPTGHVVIFKFGGKVQSGLDTSSYGAQRTLLLEILCSVIGFCATKIHPFVSAKPAVAPPCTLERLQLLQTITNKP